VSGWAANASPHESEIRAVVRHVTTNTRIVLNTAFLLRSRVAVDLRAHVATREIVLSV
jgi:hypothetical protein